MNRHGEIMVWIHQSERRRDDSMTIRVGVVSQCDLKLIFELTELAIAYGLEQSILILPS